MLGELHDACSSDCHLKWGRDLGDCQIAAQLCEQMYLGVSMQHKYAYVHCIRVDGGIISKYSIISIQRGPD